MKKLICFVFAFIITLSGCSKWNVEIVDPTKPVEEESELTESEKEEEQAEEAEPEMDIEEVPEEDATNKVDTEKEYFKSFLPSDIIAGHTSNSYFTDNCLYFSAPTFSKDSENGIYDGEICIYKSDLSNETTEIIKCFGNDSPSILTFAEDSEGGIYYILRECIEPEEKYVYVLCDIGNSDGNVLIDVGNDFPALNGFVNDGENWCASSSDSIYFLDGGCLLRRKMEFPYDGWISGLIHIGNDLAVVANAEDNYKIYLFDSERTELLEYASLPENVSTVFGGSGGYEFLYLAYDENFVTSLYGWKNGEPECLIDFADYGIEDIGVLNVCVDSAGSIFTVKDGDFYGKTPVSDVLIFKK